MKERLCEDRGLGIPIKWYSGSLTMEEIESFRNAPMNALIKWRSFYVRVVGLNPLIIEESYD